MGDEADEKFEEKVRVEDYKIWKKNAPFLYDLVLTHALEWPSLTCEWIPDESGAADPRHKLLLGTHTHDGEPNHLVIATIKLPGSDEEEEASGKQQSINQNSAKIDITMKINHDGEVNRARAMPQNRYKVATKSPTADVLIFDVSKHPSVPLDDDCRPDARCTGHTKEGYGLCWNPIAEGQLLSGSDDAQICVWDLNGASGTTKATGKWQGHTDVVEDVMWHCHSPNLFGSVGDDRLFCVWDTRLDKPSIRVEEAHSQDINNLAFNPHHEFLAATASHDTLVRLWDLRNTSAPIFELAGHKKHVTQLQWAPHNGYVLATCGADRRVRVWDLQSLGVSQSEEEAADGPPELLFVHGGHTSLVSDFAWNPQANWLMASVAEDNIIQIWKMADSIYANVRNDNNKLL